MPKKFLARAQKTSDDSLKTQEIFIRNKTEKELKIVSLVTDSSEKDIVAELLEDVKNF